MSWIAQSYHKLLTYFWISAALHSKSKSLRRTKSYSIMCGFCLHKSDTILLTKPTGTIVFHCHS